MQAIRIEKLATAVPAGDWHDPLLRWIVEGPGNEAQLFSTKKEAILYAQIRQHAGSQLEAINSYVATA
jgi:hypothetical protein